VLGFEVAMDLGSVVTLASPANPTAQITLMRRDGSPRLLPQVTIEVADVDAVYNQAVRRGARILFPPIDESWGGAPVLPVRPQRRRHQRHVPPSGPGGRQMTEARRISHVPQHQDAS